jgi:hypothetical protein
MANRRIPLFTARTEEIPLDVTRINGNLNCEELPRRVRAPNGEYLV